MEHLASAVMSLNVSMVREVFSCTWRGGFYLSVGDAGHLVIFTMLSRSKRNNILEVCSVRRNWKFS